MIIKQELQDKFGEAVDLIVRGCKRSLLDIIDMQFNAVGNIALGCADPKVGTAVQQVQSAIDSTLRRRIHNDVSDIGPATMVAFELEVQDTNPERFKIAIQDVTQHCEDSLLDVVSIELGSLGSFKSDDADAIAAIISTRGSLDILGRRIKSDVGTARQKILSSFQIVQNGGRIPSFGRTPEQMRPRNGYNVDERAERMSSRYRPQRGD